MTRNRVRSRRLARTSIAVAAALAGVVAGAAEPATSAEPALVAQAPAQELPAVQIHGNYINSVGSSDAASAGTVTSKLIESRPTLRPAEVLEFVPGVIVTQHSGDGKANQYFLRGFNLDHGTDFATFVDGMPVNMPTHAHGQGYSDLNWLIPELVEPHRATARGRTTPRRATSRRPARRASTSSTRCRAASPRSTLGERRYARALLANSSPVGNGNLLYAVEAAHNDGPWDNPEKFHRLNGVLRYSFGGGDHRSSLTAMGYSAGWNATDQIPQRAVDSGLIGRFGAIDPSDGGRTERYSLSFQTAHRLDDGEFTPQRLRDPVAASTSSPTSPTSSTTRSISIPARPTATSSSRPSSARCSAWRRAAAWNMKLGGHDIDDHGRPAGAPRPARSGRPLRTVARQRVATTQESRVRETSVGALRRERSSQWTPWLRSVAGVRADRFDFDVDQLDPGEQRQGAARPSPRPSCR